MNSGNLKEVKRVLAKYLVDNKKVFPKGIRSKHFSLIEMKYEINGIYCQYYGYLPGKAEHKYIIDIILNFENLICLVSAMHYIGTRRRYKINSCVPIKIMNYGGNIERNVDKPKRNS